jgi:hypothetical protein
MPEAMHRAARGYNEPPVLERRDLDAMWTAIESASFSDRAVTPIDAGRPSGIARFFSTANLLPLAAVLLLGVAIGRFAIPRTSQPAPATPPVAQAPRDSVAVPEPYQTTTSRYLGQATALLAALPAEVGPGNEDSPYRGRAHDLLLTTRLLLDTPASGDPRFRTLLEDLELVLAQVVRLQSAESAEELELIRQALEQRDVLPRLRSAVANISADD